MRASGPERLTVAGKLELPQVVCPGGSEHLGILVDVANQVPAGWKDHQVVWHSPHVFVPRLNAEQQDRVAAEIGKRLAHTSGNCTFLMPLKGVSAYSAEGGELFNPELDAAYWSSLQRHLPPTVEIQSLNLTAEDPLFVEHAVETLVAMMEG